MLHNVLNGFLRLSKGYFYISLDKPTAFTS